MDSAEKGTECKSCTQKRSTRKPSAGDTAQRIAQQRGVSRRTILLAAKFARGVDAAEEVAPGTKDVILSGQGKASRQVVSSLAEMSPAERKPIAEAIRDGTFDRSMLRQGSALEEEDRKIMRDLFKALSYIDRIGAERIAQAAYRTADTEQVHKIIDAMSASHDSIERFRNAFADCCYKAAEGISDD